MRCIEIVHTCLLSALYNRLTLTWDVLKSMSGKASTIYLGININMRCIEMLLSRYCCILDLD